MGISVEAAQRKLEMAAANMRSDHTENLTSSP